MTYRNCKTLISAGRYTYDDMFSMLDLFMLVNRITQDEYIELTGMLVQPVEPDTLPPVEDESQQEESATKNQEETL